MKPTAQWLAAKLPLEREYVCKQMVNSPKHQYYNIYLLGTSTPIHIENRIVEKKQRGDSISINGARFWIDEIDHEFLVATVIMD